MKSSDIRTAMEIVNDIRAHAFALVVLDEIVAIIESLQNDDPSEDYEYGYNNALSDVVEIIDKYRKEK